MPPNGLFPLRPPGYWFCYIAPLDIKMYYVLTGLVMPKFRSRNAFFLVRENGEWWKKIESAKLELEVTYDIYYPWYDIFMFYDFYSSVSQPQPNWHWKPSFIVGCCPVHCRMVSNITSTDHRMSSCCKQKCLQALLNIQAFSPGKEPHPHPKPSIESHYSKG